MIRRLMRATGFDIVRHRHRGAAAYEFLRTRGIRTVVDIGAHEGSFSVLMHELLPDARVVAFEPLPAAFAALQRALPGSVLEAHNVAIGSQNGLLDFYQSSWAQSSSLLPMADRHRQAFPESSAGRTLQVQCRRLDDVLDARELEPGILIKIDVQGGEDLVIAGGTRIFQKAAVVVAEVSFEALYEGQPLFRDIFHTLAGLGFSYHGHLYQLNDPQTGLPLQADGLFIRSEEQGAGPVKPF